MKELPRIGDRIRLVAMHDDPGPIATGQNGTVVDVTSHGSGADAWHQIDVSWDSGRALMLVSPPDEFEIIAGETQWTGRSISIARSISAWTPRLVRHPSSVSTKS